MSKIKKSLKTISGDLTINNGDVIITDPTKGIVMQDNVAENDRIKSFDDSGVKTVSVEELP